MSRLFFFSSRRRHTRSGRVTGVQTVCSSDLHPPPPPPPLPPLLPLFLIPPPPPFPPSSPFVLPSLTPLPSLPSSFFLPPLTSPTPPFPPQERSLLKQEGDTQSMQSSLAALQSELGTELLSQLDPGEQTEVWALRQTINELLIPTDFGHPIIFRRCMRLSPPSSQVEQLADEIQSLQQQLRSSLKDRTQVHRHLTHDLCDRNSTTEMKPHLNIPVPWSPNLAPTMYLRHLCCTKFVKGVHRVGVTGREKQIEYNYYQDRLFSRGYPTSPPAIIPIQCSNN